MTDQEHQDNEKSEHNLSRISIQNEFSIFKSCNNNSRSRSNDDFKVSSTIKKSHECNTIQNQKNDKKFQFDKINKRQVKSKLQI